jgi:O-antigen/teichoic acid export membrane protein
MSARPNIQLLNITILNFLARITFYVFIFFAGYIASRSLTTDQFGQIHFITLILNICWIVFNLGLPNVLARYLSQSFFNNQINLISKLFRFTFWGGIITMICTVISYFVIYHYNAFDFTIGYVLTFAVSQLLLSYLTLVMQSFKLFKPMFVANVIGCALGLLFLWLAINQFGGVAYLIAYTLVYFILIGTYLYQIQKAIKVVKQQTSTEYYLPSRSNMLKTSLYFAVSAILAGILWQRFELSVLKLSVGYSELAIYGVAFTFIALFAEPLKLIPSVLLYYFANITEHAKASVQFARFFKHFSWLVIFIGVFVWFNASALVITVYTDKYIESVNYVHILLVGIIPGTFSYVMMHTHVGMGKARFLLVQDILSALVFVILFFVLFDKIGIEGAAWAKSIAMLFSVMLGLIYTSARLKFDVPFKELVASLALSLLLVIPTVDFGSWSLLLLMLKCALLAGLYVVVSWYTRIIERGILLQAWDKTKEMFVK